jgi:hypothetical protein
MEHPLRDHILVFGSAATAVVEPNDIDIFIDYTHQVKEIGGLGDLMVLARKHYGRLDPFVLKDNTLWTRNDTASGWIKARNARGLIAACRKGIPLSALVSDGP